MKNEIADFFQKNAHDLEYISQEAKVLVNHLGSKSQDQRSYILLNILFEFIQTDKLDILINKLKEISPESAEGLYEFTKENQALIVDYFTSYSSQKEELPKLIDIQWKFVSLQALDKLDSAEVTPKIFMKLIFNNNQTKIIETDFAGFKKLHEELEEVLSSFNSTYSRRIETFAK